MELKTFFKSKILQMIVISLIINLPNLGLSQSDAPNASKQLPKSFAVFVARYNTYNNSAIGGVAGTAFFISPSKAVTAFHVLQAASFSPAPNYEKIKIWLVHEGRPAIEVKLSHLRERENIDMTMIDFENHNVASPDEIYSLAETPNQQAKSTHVEVESDGFIANSIGPELFRNGSDLIITSVPHLQRLHVRGQILKTAEINIDAKDVKMTNTPCLQATYQPIVGLSGGPLLKDGRVLAMNSFADPSRQSTWAVHISTLKDIK